MKLLEVVNLVRRKFSEGRTLINNPVQVFSQQARNFLQDRYERFEIPGRTSLERKVEPEIEQASTGKTAVATVPRATAVGAIAQEPPLILLPPLVIDSASDRSSFVSLPRGEKLNGKRWGTYTVENCLRTRGNTRLYAGKNNNDEPVLIKEYQLLERELDVKEIRKRQVTFEKIIDLNSKISQGPDFRLVKLVDGFVSERRCYLVTKPISNSLSLEEYIVCHGAMTTRQVHEVLRQVLETLWFLHAAYRVRFSADVSEKGLPHGNLSLNSLVIRSTNSSDWTDERQFFIHVTDLELWEHLFYPMGSKFRQSAATTSKELGSKKQDLYDLGAIAVDLLRGEISERSEFESELKTGRIWSQIQDSQLQHFIRRLLGSDTSSEASAAAFPNAEAALQALSHHSTNLLPSLEQSTLTAEEEPEKQWSWHPLFLLAFIILFGLFGFWLVDVLGRVTRQVQVTPSSLPSYPPCCIDESISSLSFTYLVEPGETWESALKQTYVEGKTGVPTNLMQRLKKNFIQPWTNDPVPGQAPIISDREDIFEQFEYGSVDVALMRLADDVEQRGLKKEPLAYDAVVVFVAFSDASNERNSLNLIEQKITLEELKQVYTGKIKELNGHPIKPLFPKEAQTIEIFKSLIFSPEQEQDFQATLVASRNEETETNNAGDKVKDDIYARIQAQFQAQSDNEKYDVIVGIGFDRLSRVYGQCSVYPLAIVNEQQKAVQVLETTDGKPIEPTTDLCSKGSYQVNIEALKAYPLKYDLGVVFKEESRTDGEELAKLLRTTEGEYLMSQVGLFPRRSLSEIRRELYRSAQP
jgi:ABC-type phosphate transport system substrate-binding protein